MSANGEAVRQVAAIAGHDGLPVCEPRAVVAYRQGAWVDRPDVVASEYALTVYVDDEEFVTVVCTPEYLEDLVTGFLASEGVIRRASDIADMSINRSGGAVRVRLQAPLPRRNRLYNKRYIGSCCGKSRQSFYFQSDAYSARRVDDAVSLKAEEIFTLMDQLDVNAQLFYDTGGVHVAAICDASGFALTRADIGRHNALDKLYGHALREDLAMTGKVVTFSGRLSSEVLLKVGRIGVGIVLCRSAPTALALTIAEDLNITTVGFIRDRSFNVYTHPWRIAQG